MISGIIVMAQTIDSILWPATLPDMPKPSITNSLKSTESRIQASITDLARHMTSSIGSVGRDVKELRTEVHEIRTEMKDGFESVHVELEAIKELVAVRKELQNLVRELKSQGVVLDESRIFVA